MAESISLSSDEVRSWLNSTGELWVQNVRKAASIILDDYRESNRDLLTPVDLSFVATLNHASIKLVSDLNKTACIMPISGGFKIFVKNYLSRAQMRSAIAHELAHTLFYSHQNGNPQRMFPISKREEVFCFDVSRHILAPEWKIAANNLRSTKSPGEVLFSLLDQRSFGLSFPVAARVILQDHSLLTGVAAYYKRIDGKWTKDINRCYSSKNLTRKQKNTLHARAKEWLEEENIYSREFHICGKIYHAEKEAIIMVAE